MKTSKQHRTKGPSVQEVVAGLRLSESAEIYVTLLHSVRLADNLPGPCSTSFRADGLTLVLDSRRWPKQSPRQKADCLNHEAGHVLSGHFHLPEGSKTNMLAWNLAADAVMHELGHCPSHALDAAAGGSSVTFHRLGLQPMAIRPAYELLKTRSLDGLSPCCTLADDAIESGGEIWADFACTFGSGAGRDISPPDSSIVVTPRRPPWADRLLDFCRSKRDAYYTYARLRRGVNVDLPTRTRLWENPQIFIDTSGSISPADLAAFLGVLSHPVLAHSEVYLFDTQVTGPLGLPLRQWKVSHGGTLYGPPASRRRRGSAIIWLTDCQPYDAWPEPYPHEVWVTIGAIAPRPRRSIRVTH